MLSHRNEPVQVLQAYLLWAFISVRIQRYPTSNDLRIDYDSLPDVYPAVYECIACRQQYYRRKLVLRCLADNMRWNIDFAKHLLNVK